MKEEEFKLLASLWQRETLPAVLVENKVVWVNPEMITHFMTLLNQPANWALFFTCRPDNLEERFLQVFFENKRSGFLGPVIISDVQGKIYQEVGLKGCGHILAIGSGKLSVHPSDESYGYSNSAAGMAEFSALEYEAEMAEYLYSLGLRVTRTIAIAKIFQIVDFQGKKISLEAAKKAGILSLEREPAIALRAFTTALRIDNVFDNRLNKELALSLVAKERGSKSLTFKEYLEWFAETLGKQIGLLHQTGLLHGYLTEHNITLDCHLVDFDSVEKSLKTIDFQREQIRSFDSYLTLTRALVSYPSVSFGRKTEQELLKIFANAYNSVMADKPDLLIKNRKKLYKAIFDPL